MKYYFGLFFISIDGDAIKGRILKIGGFGGGAPM
jgi:hypothetical protein